MKNRIRIILIFLLGAVYGNTQTWRIELEKHTHKSISEINIEMEKYFEQIGKTKANKYHKYMRWYDYASKHQDENGFQFNHSQKNQELLKRMKAQIKRLNKVDDQNSRHYHGNWTSINPVLFQVGGGSLTPSMGRINCIAKPSPTSSIIYAGTATGGVWKTFNNGASWIPLWDGMVQTGVSSIVIDYNNPNHILALTGDANSRFIPTSGVYHSYDAGSTWLAIDTISRSDQIYGFKLLQSKIDPNEYFFCEQGTGEGIIRFNLNTTGLSLEGPDDFIFDIEHQINENVIWASGTSGIYRKSGNNPWQEVTHANLPTNSVTRSAIAMAPSNKDVIYYMVANISSGFYGLYKSPDKGQTWDVMYDTNDPDIMTYQCNYNFTLDIDPNDENKVFVGTGFFYESKIGSNGLEFNQIENYIHADIHNSHHIGGYHYVCTDGGISVKEPGSNIYNGINNGLLCTQFYDLDVYGTQIIGGTQDNGTKVWNIGDQIANRPIGGDGFDCVIDPSNPSTMFGSTTASKQISTNGGSSFSPFLLGAEWHDPMVFAVDNPKKMILHTEDTLRISYDNGASFPTSMNVFSSSLNVNSISQCEDNPNVLYLAKGDSLARTENFNASPQSVVWTKSEMYDKDFLRGILVHPDSCDVVFRVRGGYSNVQIEKSIDGGDVFEDYSEGISQLPVYCIYYDHVNGNGFYIGTELGVYYRNSTMNEWIPFSTYLPNVPVYDLKINNNYIYAATFGRGIWRSPRYKTCSTNLILYDTNDPTSGTASGQQIHKASNIIVSDRIIRGGVGTNVLYQAGNFIDLTEGFHARSNNLFTAKAAGCLE